MTRCVFPRALPIAIALASCSTSTLLGADLTLEQVLPERLIAASSFNDVGALLDRLDKAGIFKALGEATSEDMATYILSDLPASIRERVEAAMGDQDPQQLFKGVELGIGVWPTTGSSSPMPVELAVWVKLGENSDGWGELIETSIEDGLSDGDLKRETIAGRDLFEMPGRGGGFMLYRSPWIAMTTSREGMERIVHVLDDQPVDAPLGESEAWIEAVDLMGGNTGMRCLVFPEVLLDAVQTGSSEMAMLGMARPIMRSALGLHEVWALRLSPGTDDTLLELNGGFYMPEGVNGLPSLMVNGDLKNMPITQFLSENLVSIFVANIAFDKATDLAQSVLDESPMLFMAQEPFKEMRPQWDAILGALGTHVAVLNTVERPITADSMQAIGLIEVRQPQQLSDALSQMLGEVGFKARDFQGHQIWSMDMPAMVPGVPSGTTAICAAGEWLFIGSDDSVESAIRNLGARGAFPKWPGGDGGQFFGRAPKAMLGAANLQETFGVVREIEALQAARIRTALQQEDPELWEELAEDLSGNPDSTLDYFKALGTVLGSVFWDVSRSDRGFTVHGRVTAAP